MIKIDFSRKDVTIQDIIDFIKSVKDFRVKGKLPFGTVDYMVMDDYIEYLEKFKGGK